jgi:hypothetical protein
MMEDLNKDIKKWLKSTKLSKAACSAIARLFVSGRRFALFASRVCGPTPLTASDAIAEFYAQLELDPKSSSVPVTRGDVMDLIFYVKTCKAPLPAPMSAAEPAT